MNATCLDRTEIRLEKPTWLQRLARRLDRYRQMRLDRAAFKNMLTLDDELLDDIGVTRAEVEAAAGLPLEINAARTIEEIARQRRASRLL